MSKRLKSIEIAITKHGQLLVGTETKNLVDGEAVYKTEIESVYGLPQLVQFALDQNFCSGLSTGKMA